MGIAEGCRLKRDIFRDSMLAYDDGDLPEDRLCDKLRTEQNKYYSFVRSC